MLMHKPRSISEAKTDGTNYIVWDNEDLKEWVVAYYNDGYWIHNGWPIGPTHFVEYLPDPTKED